MRLSEGSPPSGELEGADFHPDHLGSSSYITNLAGVVTQHMEYLPFGELLVDEHLNSHNSPFKFNAKELDPETGNYYYGARYYSPKYNLMLSVDPMYELYPSFSPYAYTLQNPIRYTDPTGMIPENSECGCPDPPCNDPKIYPYTAGEQRLDPVVLSSQKSANKSSNSSISFSGDMPNWMGTMQVGHYETSFVGNIGDYNKTYGTNYTYEDGYMQWYYDNHYKPQYDELMVARAEAGKYFGYGFLGALAAPFALSALTTSGGYSLLLNSGYRGFFARAGLDASIQYLITGDVNLIGATASGFGFGKYGLMANAAGASTDYFLFSRDFTTTFDGTKSLSHVTFDLLGSYGPNFSRALASPNNSLGPVGLEATGRIWGTLMSHKLKQ